MNSKNQTNLDMRNITRLPSGNFRVRVEHGGGVLSGVVPTHALAIELRDELKRQIVDGELQPAKGATAKDLGPRFLGSRLGNRDSDNETNRWNNHVASAPWARKSVTAVTRSDGAAWLRLLKRKRLSFDPEKHGERESKFLGWQTRKHCLNLARAFFSWVIDQEVFDLAGNPFVGLRVTKEDGDEDDGYQEGWYLDGSTDEQERFLATWDRDDLEFDARDRMEKWIVAFAMGSGLRRGEQWCLHLDDVHVGEDEPRPRVVVRFGSWDATRKRYRAPKGRKGEKKSRTVYLHGIALEAARAWLALRSQYMTSASKGKTKRYDSPLMFPTERGARRTGNPRSWKKAVDAFGVVPRIGRKVWWHLLRHTCASSLVSGWWGVRWSLESVCKVLGHTDARTTQIYAHLAPSALEADAARAHAAYLGSRHDAVTPQRPAARKAAETTGYARSDSNGRHPASKAEKIVDLIGEKNRRVGAVTAIRHVLEMVADEQLVLPAQVVDGLGMALDLVGLVGAPTAEEARTA